MGESILIIGPHRQVHDLFNPLWVELGVEKQRFNSTEAAIEVLQSGAPPSAILISYPLWDSSVEDILAAMTRILGSERSVPVLLLAPADALFEVAALEDRGVKVLSEGKPPEDLVQELQELLGRAQRDHPRFIVRMSVQVESGSVLRACQSEDISLSGMLIRTSEEFPIGADLELEFTVADEDESIRCRARVVRFTHPGTEKTRGMGVRFTAFEEDGAERLERYLSE